MGRIGEVVAVIVAADSATARVVEAIDELTAHLSPQNEPWACPLCCTESWPCSRFNAAARQVMTAGLQLRDWIPNDLHARLWGKPKSRSPAPPAPRPQAGPRSDTWFDEESPDG